MTNNTGQIVLIGAIGLAAVYLLTRRQTSTPAPYYPYPGQQIPTQTTTQTQTQQLLDWAKTQVSGSTITNVISNLDWQGIADLWGKIFGSGGSSSGSGTYSGGGTDTIDNPYPEYDPYYTGGDIWT